MEIFSAQKVTKRFATQTALDSVSISVPVQSIFGLLGPNGAGKTTLLRIINRIIAPDEGEIMLEGKKMTDQSTRLIGYLPEERGLYKKMKVGEQALYLAQLKGLSHAESLKRLKFWFEKFEMSAWWNKKVEELSKGMQQKVQFLTTIIHEPKLLIFDEPFSGFDPINANMLKEEILAQKEKGATIIFSTHNMASVEELCDHIALINQARKILDGRVSDIKKTYQSNSYEVSITQGTTDIRSLLENGFELMEEKRLDGIQTMKIRLNEGRKPNELIQNLLPYAEIQSFHEIIPTMNDIFIRKVEENIQATHQS